MMKYFQKNLISDGGLEKNPEIGMAIGKPINYMKMGKSIK